VALAAFLIRRLHGPEVVGVDRMTETRQDLSRDNLDFLPLMVLGCCG
jgi:hypothetical protein